MLVTGWFYCFSYVSWIVNAEIKFSAFFMRFRSLSIYWSVVVSDFDVSVMLFYRYRIRHVSVDFPIVSCGFPRISCRIHWSSGSFTISGIGWKNTFPGTMIFRSRILHPCSYIFPAGSCRNDAGKAPFPVGSGRNRLPEPLSRILLKRDITY
jgi:hypothetical protein